ncbi:MAG: S8 family peptidase [Proteobacteria bacterium]|nr:S8 family peptidase [Pseudomonadota bacterium]
MARVLGLAAACLVAVPALAADDSAAGPTASPAENLRERLARVLVRQGFEPQVAAAAQRRQRAALMRRAMAATPAAAVPAAGQARAVGLVLRLRDPESRRALAAGQAPSAALVADIAAAAGVALSYLRPMSGGQVVFRFDAEVDPGVAPALAERVAQLSAVERAEPDWLLQHRRLSYDPGFSQQWNLRGASQGYPGGIDAPALWEYFIGSTATVVAVVDSGVVAHPDFGSRLLQGYDFVSSASNGNDGNGRDGNATDPGDWTTAGLCGSGSAAESSSWHGTHVAGIIAAGGDNNLGVAGIDWNTRILPVRVLGRCGGTVSDIVDGIRWAAGLDVPGVPKNTHPAHVINLSLGGYSPTGCQRSYRDAIAEARGQGALLVVAAGNDSDDFEHYVPANCEGVMTVVAVDRSGELASYSNYSFAGQVAAPGGDMDRHGAAGGIYSTVGLGDTTLTGYGYSRKQGTSMAAPHVAGIASLAFGLNDQLAGEELRYIIELAASEFPASSSCNTLKVCGSGIANALVTAGVAVVMADYQLVYEFYNEDLNHYFRTGKKSDAAGVNRGEAGHGWLDTGDYFYGWTSAVEGAIPICRFYGTPGRGPNSHVYIASGYDCEQVKLDPGWTYEGTGFYAKLPLPDGTCPGDSVPVYRVYNNRWMFNDSNHRFTTDKAVYQQMISKGWLAEGVRFCAFV